MSSDICSVIIGASFTLLGVIVGNIISFFQAKKQHDWHVKDSSRIRLSDILDARAKQSEIYVTAFAEDFRSLIHDIEFILSSDDPTAIAERSQKPFLRKDLIDPKIFAHGPSISSFNDKNLKEHYEQMNQAYEDLKVVFYDICQIIDDLGNLPDINNFITSKNDCWNRFSKNLGKFYARLDKLRAIIPN